MAIRIELESELNTEMIVVEFLAKCDAYKFVNRRVQEYSDGLDHYPDELYRTRSELPAYLQGTISKDAFPRPVSDKESEESEEQ